MIRRGFFAGGSVASAEPPPSPERLNVDAAAPLSPERLNVGAAGRTGAVNGDDAEVDIEDDVDDIDWDFDDEEGGRAAAGTGRLTSDVGLTLGLSLSLSLGLSLSLPLFLSLFLSLSLFLGLSLDFSLSLDLLGLGLPAEVSAAAGRRGLPSRVAGTLDMARPVDFWLCAFPGP